MIIRSDLIDSPAFSPNRDIIIEEWIRIKWAIVMSSVSKIVFGIFLICSLCASVWAQATAQINGAVKDQSGAVLPGVEITVTQADTSAKRTAVTDENGSYILSNLPIGPYRLEAALPGFRTYVQTGILLQVNSNPVVNAVL